MMTILPVWRGSKIKSEKTWILAVFVHAEQMINFWVLNHIS